MNRYSVADSATDTAREAISVLREEFEGALAEARRTNDPDELDQVRDDVEDLVRDLMDLEKQARFYIEEARELEDEAENAHEELADAVEEPVEDGVDYITEQQDFAKDGEFENMEAGDVL